jgi:hypothetical protein
VRTTTVVRVSKRFIEAAMTLGWQTGPAKVVQGLPAGSELVGVGLSSFDESRSVGDEIELEFLLPEGAIAPEETVLKLRIVVITGPVVKPDNMGPPS